MADATTSNQGHGITSQTSGHVAQNTAPDVCFTPDKKAVIPHDNAAKVADATEHTSAKTEINGGRTIRQGDAIGAPSKSGDGAACGKGVASGTCQEEARTVTGSPNVHAEGKPVARKSDPTTQNHGNTVGHNTGGDPGGEEKEVEEEKKKACKLDKDTAICKHGREVTPTKDGKILEIASPCHVKITATRINAKVAGAPPECAEGGVHTKWIIKQEKKGKPTRTETKTTDVLMLDASWFAYDAESELEGKADANDMKGKFRQEAHDSDEARKWRKDPEGRSRGQIADDIAEKKQGRLENAANIVSGGQAIYNAVGSIKELIEVYFQDREPITVEVEGEACVGTCKYTFKSFPHKGAEWKIDKELLEKIKAVVGTIEKLFRVFQKVCALAGAAIDASIHLLEGFELEAKVRWDELDGDKPNGKKKFQCDRYWSVMLKGEICTFKPKFAIPIVAFANAFVPGSGSTIATFLNYIGLEATIGVDIKFTISAQVGIDKAPGEKLPAIAGGFPLSLDVYFNVKIAWRSSFELSGGVVLVGKPELMARCPVADLFAGEIVVEAGLIKLGFRGVAKVDFLWWNVDQKFEYFPEAFMFSYPEFAMKALAALK